MKKMSEMVEMSYGKNTKVYEWWKSTCEKMSDKAYEGTDAGSFLVEDVENKEITFGEVLEGMKNNRDFYDLVGVGWSEVRIVIFNKMCEIFDVDYEVIYSLWLGGVSDLAKDMTSYQKLANYRGKTMIGFKNKISKLLHWSVDGDKGVEYWKARFSKLVDDCEKICA